ncbi:hypothetical protein [Fusibacter sp. JL216-2]|uniref:hypothetical protein n=1 Tax=Fusibacter sp. JL216-2 TaxID=3071453 RepID=UPI003D336F41
MKNRLNLTVIEGGYGRKLHSGYHFLRARATNTRLMGVVGVHVVWQKSEEEYFHELYHLDYESYGIDGYEYYINPDEAFLNEQIMSMMGGLGGDFVSLEAKDVRIMLQSAVAVAPECLGEYPEIEEAFPNVNKTAIYNADEYDVICRALSPETKAYGTIHYFMMRTVGHDWSGRRALWNKTESNAEFRSLTVSPSTLIRESIKTISEGLYEVTSLIDGQTGYYMYISEIALNESSTSFKVKSAEIVQGMKVSSIEAAMMLKKKEFISVYTLLDENFGFDLEDKYPELMANEHEAGVLYSRFKDNNDHVEHSIFYLSGDILGLYYITDENQMLISSFSEESLEQIESELLNWSGDKLIRPAGQFVIDVPLLYDFVNSGYGDFFDFLNGEE